MPNFGPIDDEDYDGFTFEPVRRRPYNINVKGPMTMKKITKKFYVGANKVFNEHTYGKLQGKTWAKATEKEAITHAKEILEDNPEQEYCTIVKIIKVVRRKKTPIVVESV